MKFFSLIFLLSLISCSKKEEIDTRVSTLSFAYDQNNTANYKYNFENIKSFKEDPHSIFKDIIHTMPLYLETKKNKHLILSSNKNELISYNLKNKKVLFKTELPGIRITSTPVYNPIDGYIYIKTAGSNSSQQIITSIDLSGKIQSSFKLDLNKHFQNKQDVSTKLQCKTALSLILERQKIVFGCSIKSQVYNKEEDIVLYGTHQGVTGAVFSYDIKEKRIDTFKTSMKTDSQNSGMDTGIYLSGGSFPVFKDEILVSTGNGPYNGVDNFGCSVLKLKILKNEIKLLDHLGLERSNANECHSLNLDMTSSSPIRGNDSTVYIISKDGVLHAFDFETMGKKFYQKKVVGELPHYSQGAILENNKESLFVSHWSNYFTDKKYSFATALERSSKLLETKGFKKETCLGSIDSTDARDFELLFTGDFRNSYIEVPSQLANELTSPNHPTILPTSIPKFYPVKDLWPNYSKITKKDSNFKANNKTKQTLSFYDFEERSIFLLDFKNIISKKLGQSPYSSIETSWPTIFKCSSKKDKENIYFMKKIEQFSSGRGLVLASKRNDQLETKVIITGKSKNPNKTSVTIFKHNNKNYVLTTAHKDNLTNVKIFNAQNMKEEFSFSFSGESYFSMPLITPSHFLFPTRANGIKSFKIVFDEY